MGFSDIKGHDRPVRVLRRALASGRIPHAYLFWGPEGVGKERTALEVARALLCTDPSALGRAEGCGRCSACVRVEAGTHPDLHVLAPEGARIAVDQVRSLQEALSFRAFEGGRKVVIIRDGFRLTREAANALLKTLEEPPASTHIFLLALHRDQILPTLVSRCQVVRFDPLPREAVEELLVIRGMDREQAARLAEGAGGRPGAVLGADAEGRLQALREAEDLAARWDALPVAERFRVAAAWAADRQALRERLDALMQVLSRRARENPAGSGRLTDRQHAVARVLEWIEANANPELAMDALLLDLAGAEWEDRWPES